MSRLANSFKEAWRPALRSAWWIIKITIPVSLGVTLLQYFGVIQEIAAVMEPAFKMIGLRGEAALVLATSFLINIYSAIAVMQTIPFTGKEVTILALMCLIAHNLIVETAIQKKTGSSGVRMLLLRVIGSFFAGAILNLLIREDGMTLYKAIPTSSEMPLRELMMQWANGAFFLTIRLVVIITGLNFLQKILKAYGILGRISRGINPIMRIFGLKPQSAMLWLVANVVGLTYGAAILIEYNENHRIDPEDADRLNHHLAFSHSLLEDTLLFAMMGVAIFWLTVPRLILAILAVRGGVFLSAQISRMKSGKKKTPPCSSAENRLGL